MTPSVNIQKTDGNLGASGNTERILAIIGTASAGDFDTALSATNTADVEDEFTSGELVEAASYAIGKGIPVVCIRGNEATPGDYGTIDDAGVTGTAVVAEGVTEPDGTYDVVVEILTGGALGTTGITFRYSLDGGVSWSEEKGLGTSLTMTLEHGVSFALSVSTATLIAGDTWSVTTSAPKLSTTDLADSLAALKDYDGEWLRVLVLAEADATIIEQCDTWAKTFWADGKFPEVIISTRPRALATSESRATYQTALAAIAVAVQASEVVCCADQCEMISTDGWRVRRPTSIAVAVRSVSLPNDSIYPEEVALGALDGVFLTTNDGERNYHDEARHGGLDALGFTTLRTFAGRPIIPGVYVNQTRTMAGTTSDFAYAPRSFILNRIIESAHSILVKRLNKTFLLNQTTGTIREDAAVAIEGAVNAELRTLYSDPGLVSGVQMRLSRTDNVLSTDELTFTIDDQPLGRVAKFRGKAGLVRKLPTT